MNQIATTPPTPTDAAQFGLASFLDLLPQRTPLLEQCATSYERFKLAHLRDLHPTTALQTTVAENLIANEWELQQLRRMLDRETAHRLASSIKKPAYLALEQAHEDKLDAEFHEWVSAGNDRDEWEGEPFDESDATADALELARQALSTDPDELAKLEAKLAAMGVDVMYLMAQVHIHVTVTAQNLGIQIRNLEKRRREIKADFDALQKASPIRAAMEAIEDAEIVE